MGKIASDVTSAVSKAIGESSALNALDNLLSSDISLDSMMSNASTVLNSASQIMGTDFSGANEVIQAALGIGQGSGIQQAISSVAEVASGLVGEQIGNLAN